MRLYRLVLLSSVFLFFTACDQEDVAPRNCEIIGEELGEFIFSQRLQRVLVIVGDNSTLYNGPVVINGCTMTLEGVSFNLDQLISYDRIEDTDFARVIF
ncbi:MAG: hypothetical protein AAF433_07375 [Bacteroidota bacterium]